MDPIETPYCVVEYKDNKFCIMTEDHINQINQINSLQGFPSYKKMLTGNIIECTTYLLNTKK